MDNQGKATYPVCDTPRFKLMMDEDLRENACQAVEKFLSEHHPVKNVQLHAIPYIIQSGGLNGLRDLIENQKSKNTKKENRAFWEFVADLILTQPGPEHSLKAFILSQPDLNKLFDDEKRGSDKKEQKRIRKANKKIMEDILEIMLDQYFLHFNSHYFYKTGGGK